jgi:ATP-binding cassette, subfamily B, bacterial MsbA
MAIIYSIIPVFIKSILDDIFDSRDYDSVQFIPLIILVLFMVQNLFRYISNYGINWIGNTLTSDLQTAIFDKLLILPTHYHEGKKSKNLVSKLTSDVIRITQDGVMAAFIFIKNVLTIIGLSMWMLYLNLELSLLALMLTTIVLLGAQIIYGRSHDAAEKKYQIIENFIQVIKESTENYKTVVLNGGQQHVLQRFQDGADQIRRFNIKNTNSSILKESLTNIVVAIALSTIFYLAIQQALTDEITAGSSFSFIVSILILAASLKQLTQENRSLQNCVAVAKDIFSVLDLETESDKGKIIIDHAQGELRFEHVSYHSALKDLSLTIRSGEKIALVGPSDKTINALINLVPRFMQPTDGKILFDGHELTTIKLDSLRSEIGFLSQSTTLFNGSIAANIAYGDMGYSTESEIISAAHAAHAIQFIRKMPQGMQTLIGRHGIRLSREQCQHIAIARTLLKNPSILMVDEIATVPDSESEYLIRSALDNLMRGRTTIIIARRKATLEKVDRIVVIENNCIVEIGGHQELLSEKGLYTELYPLYH